MFCNTSLWLHLHFERHLHLHLHIHVRTCAAVIIDDPQTDQFMYNYSRVKPIYNVRNSIYCIKISIIPSS